MIKVGQVYEDGLGLYVISSIDRHNFASVIYNNGIVCKYFLTQLYTDKMVAEHDTWQEAVNSPEFKGEK